MALSQGRLCIQTTPICTRNFLSIIQNTLSYQETWNILGSWAVPLLRRWIRTRGISTFAFHMPLQLISRASHVPHTDLCECPSHTRCTCSTPNCRQQGECASGVQGGECVEGEGFTCQEGILAPAIEGTYLSNVNRFDAADAPIIVDTIVVDGGSVVVPKSLTGGA